MVDKNVVLTAAGVSLIVSVTTTLVSNFFYFRRIERKLDETLLCNSMPQ